MYVYIYIHTPPGRPWTFRAVSIDTRLFYTRLFHTRLFHTRLFHSRLFHTRLFHTRLFRASSAQPRPVVTISLAVESRIGPKRGSGETPGKLLTRSKPNAYCIPNPLVPQRENYAKFQISETPSVDSTGYE